MYIILNLFAVFGIIIVSFGMIDDAKAEYQEHYVSLKEYQEQCGTSQHTITIYNHDRITWNFDNINIHGYSEGFNTRDVVTQISYGENNTETELWLQYNRPGILFYYFYTHIGETHDDNNKLCNHPYKVHIIHEAAENKILNEIRKMLETQLINQIENLEDDLIKKNEQTIKWKERMQKFKEDLRVAFDTNNKTKEHLIQLAHDYRVEAIESRNSCVDKPTYNQMVSEFDSLQSQYTTLQTQYNESQYTVQKLDQELADAKKKIEELESKGLELEGQSDQEQRIELEQSPVDEQTLSITIPQYDKFDNMGRTIDLYHGISDRIRIDTAYSDKGTSYYTNGKAEITIFRDTWITDKQFTASGGQYCYVGDLVVGQNTEISQDYTNTLQIKFRQSTDPSRCVGSPDITFDSKLSLNKDVYVRFVGQDGQVPFYYTGSDAVDIPKCTSTNFNSATSQLIDNTEICYGKDDNDVVLVSKILAVFGV